MTVFVAHYRSPNASAARAAGLFEFESDWRLGSKGNMHDARMAMLAQFGRDAVSWTIESIDRKKASSAEADGQLAFDFREPPAQRKRAKRVDRGRVQ